MDEVRDKLRREVMASYWEDLAPHHARGGLLLLAPAHDLLDVAEALARDDTQRVGEWLARGVLWRSRAADVERAEADDALRFQFVVVQPWVLAQALV